METNREIIKRDLDRLGIVAEITWSEPSDWDEPSYTPSHDIGIIFRTQEDMNLYKMVGEHKECWWLKYFVGEEK